jgi:SNF2 family DNA or RNA helicase
MAELGLGAVLADDMGLGKCVGPETPVWVNDQWLRADRLWATAAGVSWLDGEGEWAAPRYRLQARALSAHGAVVTAEITRLYRQWIDEDVHRVTLDDGSTVTLTRRHKLHVGGRWTNRYGGGDRITAAAAAPVLAGAPAPASPGGGGDRPGWDRQDPLHLPGEARIEAVEVLRYRGWVYDLEVAEHHNFLAAGVFCHNTIELIGHLLGEGVGGAEAPALVVCPTSVVGNWQRELERFAPSLQVTRWHGTDRPLELGDVHGVVVTTYGTLRRDVDELAKVSWSVVALDEAQHVKNPQTAGARAVRRLRSRQTVALTGTPLENRLAELWALLDVTNPGLLGTRARFTARYVAPIEKRHDRTTAARLRRLVSPFVLRRVKSDPAVISDLPDKIERTVPCTLTPEQARLYSEAVARVFDGDALGRSAMERRGRILALLTALKQICNHPAHYLGETGPLPGRSGKLAAAREIVSEAVQAGDQVLVFTQYVAMGHLLVAQFAGDLDAEVPFLHGGVPARSRDRIVDAFQAGLEGAEAPPVLVVSLRAGGTGLNLTAATHVVHYDRWWNPAVEDQATDRTHRIGQQRTVEVHKLVTAGTVEERIDELLASKRDLADAVVGSGETWITELADSELRELVSLSADASIADLEDDGE